MSRARRKLSFGRTVVAGAAGTAAVSIVMAIGRALGVSRIDLPRAIGTAFGPNVPKYRSIGRAIFYADGIGSAFAYRKLLAGKKDPMARGAAYGATHGALAASALAAAPRVHPHPETAGLAEGKRRRPSIAGLALTVAAHAVFGLVAGAVFARR